MKKLNYHHNRHKSDGIIIDNNQLKKGTTENQTSNKNYEDISNNNSNNNKFLQFNEINRNPGNIKNKYYNYQNQEIITEENLSNVNYSNTLDHIPKGENYMNIEYSKASDSLTNSLSSLIKSLSIPLLDTSKIDEENLRLKKQNKELEDQINLLKLNNNFDEANINLNTNEEPTKEDIEKLYHINRQIKQENEKYKNLINEMKLNKKNEKLISSNVKYKADFLVQSMVGSMKELIYLLENKNYNNNLNSGTTLENNTYSFIPTSDNLNNFTEQSYNEDGQFKEQNSLFNMGMPVKNSGNMNFIYNNDNSRNFKDREINFQSKHVNE